MPTLASLTNPVNQELYNNYHFNQRAAELALYRSAISASSSIHQRLLTFRSHHQNCASRRRYALANEMKQESQRADWLKRKYIDSVRQQQASQQPVSMASTSSRVSGVSASVTTSVAGEGAVNSVTTSDHHNHNHHHHHQCDVKPLGKNGCSNSTSSTGPTQSTRPPAQNSDTGTGEGDSRDQSTVSQGTAGVVRVKREPDCEEYMTTPSTPTLCPESHDTTRNEPHPLNLSEQARESEPKRRESIKAEHFKWDQDNRDDLKLTAYDVIAGVISTPPIKPLEPESDPVTSKVGGAQVAQKSPVVTGNSQHITNGAGTGPASRASKEHQELVHELDHFSKIFDEVSQQQEAIEMAAANITAGSYSGQNTDHKQHQHKQLYRSDSLTPTAKEPAGSFYQVPTYGSSQATDHEGVLQHHGASMDNKSSLQHSRGSIPRRLTLLNEVPVSPSRQPAVPLTPTTPLEHFFTTPSPTTMLPASVAQSSTPGSQTPHRPTPHHHTAHSTSPHHLQSLPGTSRHLAALPGTTHYHITSSTTPHQQFLHHHSVGPGTPHHNPVGPGTPHHNPVGPGTPHHNAVGPGTPHHNSVGPVAPHRNSVGPGTPHYHSLGPGTPHHSSHRTPQLLGSSSHQVNNPISSSAPLPHPSTPYMCQPYPATPQYRYDADPTHFPTSMATDTWTTNQIATSLSKPLPPDQVTTPISSQGTLRESIMARVSSRVEALAGHKRPLHLDLTGAPPTKMKSGELPPPGQQTPVAPPPPGYIQPSPYHTPSAHQPL